MKRLIIWVCILGLIALPAFAYQPNESATPSGNQTASATIASETGGYLYGIVVATDSTGTLTINTYDSSDAEISTATKLHPTWTVIGSSTDRLGKLMFNIPVQYNNGLRVVVAPATVTGYEVYYRNR